MTVKTQTKARQRAASMVGTLRTRFFSFFVHCNYSSTTNRRNELETAPSRRLPMAPTGK